ncbi:hypothetical protein GW17_00021875 [Ensete ventricosum]|nr:hypothetical protein GW17_00021875 [Ensete ventricosum]
MGCGGSKLEEEGAVRLCRERSQLLADAIRYRYALADAHDAYARSLRSVGDALQGLLHGATALPPPGSPVLPLPAQRKGDPLPPLTPSPLPPTAAAAAAVSVPSASGGHSHSGSHIQFHPTDSDSDEDSPLHSDGASPFHHLHADDAPVGPAYVNLNYARNRPAESSVAYQQQPPTSESIRVGSVDEPAPVSYPYYGYPYPPQGSNFYPYPSYPYTSYGGGSGGFFGSSSPPPDIPPPAVAAESSTSREPPPPPSPKASAWDFLNPFESYDNYYAPYTPSRSSKELREEEGIPDLEDEDQEVVKEAYGDPKFMASTSAATNGEYAGKVATGSKEGVTGSAGEDPDRKARSVEAGSSSEHEVHVVEKSVVTEPAELRSAVGYTVSRSYQDISEVVQEIRTQFDRASESANQLAKMLEAEEKMRVLYERKHEHLRHLSERGAEAEKIEAVEIFIRKLSTKIRIAIQVVGTISSKISQLRDEELWPQVNELIHGYVTARGISLFMGMWHVMSECHHIQCQAISEAKNLDSILSGVKLSDAYMDVIKQLEFKLVDWTTNFSAWVAAQRSYIKCLNGWLMKSIHYVPEITDDGVVPFSPGRLGAPPVFVICNYWSHSMDLISERDVVDALQAFAENVFNIWQKQKFEQQQRLLANRNMDSKLKLLERDEQLMLKQRKKMMLVSSENRISISEPVEHQGSTVNSLQFSLKQIFEAMENFSANFRKSYEVLHTRSEEEKQRRLREKAGVS